MNNAASNADTAAGASSPHALKQVSMRIQYLPGKQQSINKIKNTNKDQMDQLNSINAQKQVALANRTFNTQFEAKY